MPTIACSSVQEDSCCAVDHGADEGPGLVTRAVLMWPMRFPGIFEGLKMPTPCCDLHPAVTQGNTSAKQGTATRGRLSVFMFAK